MLGINKCGTFASCLGNTSLGIYCIIYSCLALQMHFGIYWPGNIFPGLQMFHQPALSLDQNMMQIGSERWGMRIQRLFFPLIFFPLGEESVSGEVMTMKWYIDSLRQKYTL